MPFRFVSDPPFEHDVQHRVPDVRKARDVLGFEATTSLSGMLDEVIPWLRAEDADGRDSERDECPSRGRASGRHGRLGPFRTADAPRRCPS